MAKWALLSDFDATASIFDVGSAIAKKFAGPNCWTDIDSSISKKDLTVKEAYEIVYSKMSVSDVELTEFVLGFELDPDFGVAARLFHDRGLPVLILSDGFDYYIDRLLKQNDLDWVPRFANTLTVEGRTARPTFPYHNQRDCDRCGNCKTSHLQKLKDQGYKIVYFGDGHTDRCAAENADLVFAKDYLADYLTKKGIPFTAFSRFKDALPKLKELVGAD